MPTEILIFSRKNGRALKTYGVNRSHHIMKFIFISIVVVLSCGYCASGEFEVHPRLRFNFNDDRWHRMKKYEIPELYAKYRFPFALDELNDNLFNRDDGSLEKKLNQLKKFEEVIDFERVKLMKQHHRQNPELRLNDLLLQKDDSRLFKPSNLLEEARVYAPDDDFKFIVDDSEDVNAQDVIGQPKYTFEQDTGRPSTYGKENVMENLETTEHLMQADDAEDETTRKFQGLQIMENPSDFAYAPSDPRFYRKSNDDEYESSEKLKSNNEEATIRSPSDPLSVSYRSEQKNQQIDVAFPDGETTEVTHLFGEADVVAVKPSIGEMESAGVYVIAIVAGISAAATVGLIAVGIGWYNLQKHVKNASDVEYPAYGITGPNKDLSPSGDRRLAQSAQMYHYQHQKQQIIAMESAQPSFAISRAQPGERHGSVSEADSDEENEEGDYTVYECPGLAPTGEMEVKNPLFQDDPTPAQTPAVKNNSEEKK